MSINNGFNILPWYDSLEKQNSRKWYAFGQSWPLACPQGMILPFQFISSTEITINSTIIAVNLSTSQEVDLGVTPEVVAGTQANANYYLVKQPSATISVVLPVGRYYFKIHTSTGTLYSEELVVVDNISEYIKLEYWNEDTLNFMSGEINFDEDFRFILYIPSTIGKPEYEFEEELTKRLGYKFIESQTSNKLYKFNFLAPEYICDALRLVRMCDYIKLTTKYDTYNALSFSYEPKWQDNGDLAAIDVEFDTDCIIQKLESFNRRIKDSFYNALLVEIDEPILFSTDTVAQYYTEYTTSLSYINGKLIRQLESISEAEIDEALSSIVLPVDNQADTTQKAKKMSLIALKKKIGGVVNILKKDDPAEPTDENVNSALRSDSRYLRKDKDDRSKGIIATDKGFEAGKFNAGATGAACYQDKDGNWHIETDHLKVRKKASFTEVEIETTYHVGGQQMSTEASMVVDYVFEMDSCYRCYFLKKDNNGRVIKNKWKPKDQAYCNTFNLEKQEDGTLGNHYLWRLVDATSNETIDDAETRIFGDVTIKTSDYHFVDLSKTIFAKSSDMPKAMDEIVLLGHQGDDENRQGCIIVAGAGEGSPYIYEFTGINSFVLPEPETKIKPGDNVFTGVMHIQGGSTGIKNLEDFPEEVFKAVHVGAVNLLLNSGFTGDYRSEVLASSSVLNSSSELFSKSLKHWTGSATVNDDNAAISGKSTTIGSLSQTVEMIKDESYVVSFKAKGTSVKVLLGGESVEKTLSSTYEVCYFKFISDGIGTFSISGDATICDLQLERGTIATDWKPNPNDNDKALAEFQALKYLQDAIKEGSTSILGGLILSSMVQLGNYKDGVMQKVNAGISGIYNSDDDVAIWAGGSFKQAIRTVMKLKYDKKNPPTDDEWKELANFVTTHGGDLFLRGYIYALGGLFRGTIDIEHGGYRIKIGPDSGNGCPSLSMFDSNGTELLTINMHDLGLDRMPYVTLYSADGKESTYLAQYGVVSNKEFANGKFRQTEVGPGYIRITDGLNILWEQEFLPE